MQGTAKNNKHSFIIAFAVLFLFVFLNIFASNNLRITSVLAQEELVEQTEETQETDLPATDSAEPSEDELSPEQERIFRKEQNKKKLEELATLYRAQIEVYRNAERNFSISKSQYEKIQTLAALEQAVNDTRTAMLERNKVLLTYAETIYYSVDDTTGLDLSKKNKILMNLRDLIELLRVHQTKVEASQDRVAINTVANDFMTIEKAYNSVVYEALSSIRVARIQTVYDALMLIRDDIKRQQQSEEVGALQTSQRERAYQEIENRFKVIYEALYKLNMRLVETKPEQFSRSSYQNTLGDLQSIYANLFSMIDYLLEVRKL